MLHAKETRYIRGKRQLDGSLGLDEDLMEN